MQNSGVLLCLRQGEREREREREHAKACNQPLGGVEEEKFQMSRFRLQDNWYQAAGAGMVQEEYCAFHGACGTGVRRSDSVLQAKFDEFGRSF